MVEDLSDRTLKFAIEVTRMVRSSPKDYSIAIILNQLLRSATSIGANFEEAQNASSRDDFIYKISLSLREARETRFWLRVITGSGVISNLKLAALLNESEELMKILTTIAKKSKLNRKQFS